MAKPNVRTASRDDLANIMTKAGISTAYEQVLMLRLSLAAQQFCGLAAAADRRLS